MMILRAVFFEAENVLYNYGVCHAAGMSAAHAHSPFSREAFQNAYVAARDRVKQRLGSRARHRMLYFQDMVESATPRGETPTFGLALDYYNAYWDAFFQAVTVNPGVWPVLEQMRAYDIKLGLVSNLEPELQLREALALDLTFDVVVTATEVGAPLPASDALYHAMNKLGLMPEELWVVGVDRQALVMAAEIEGVFVVRLDATQPGRLKTGEFGVQGWPGVHHLLDTVLEQQPESE